LLIVIISTSCAKIDKSDELDQELFEFDSLEIEHTVIDQDSIENLINLIKATPPFDFRGLVVLKDDKIVLEEYFATYWRSTIHDIRSAGKSITSILLGIAIDKGLIVSTDQKVFDFFPELKTKENENITIKHLLMMSSGLDADTFDPKSEGYSMNWIAKKNWVEHVSKLSFTFRSGEKWVYNDASAMLIGAIIEEKSGQKLADFAKDNLFDPLSIKEFYWYTGEGGRTGAMGNLYISTLDFAKIGALMLNQGLWDGERIVSSNWIKEITSPKISIEEIVPNAEDYGYFWYMSSKTVNDMDFEYYYASGNGGNMLYILPNEKLVVCLTSSAYGLGRGGFRSNVIFEKILASIKK